MRVAQEKVELWMRRMGYEVGHRPRNVDDAMAKHRHDLMAEENNEYLEAALAGDLAKIADALADKMFVLLGTAVAHGINLEPIFEEVHRSNMTKSPLDPVTRKGGKGPDYQPPRIAPLLLIQCTDLEDVPR